MNLESDPRLAEQWQPALEQVLRLAGDLHPVLRKELAMEARKLWHKLGISDPPPPVLESSRRRAVREHIARTQRRKRGHLMLMKTQHTTSIQC
jgi:hypothetical protein